MERPNREGVHAEGFIPSPCLLGHGVRVVKDLFLTGDCAEEFVVHVVVVVSRCNNNPIEDSSVRVEDAGNGPRDKCDNIWYSRLSWESTSGGETMC